MRHFKKALRLILALLVCLAVFSAFGGAPVSSAAPASRSASQSGEAMDAYKQYTEQVHHDDEWSYDIQRFGLFDFNGDGTEELITLGGGQMDYTKIFTFRNGAVEYVHWGTNFDVYDNGVLFYSFDGNPEYRLRSYYKMGDDFSFELVFRYAIWPDLDGETYSVGEDAYSGSRKVPFEQVQAQLDAILSGAQPAKITFYENTAEARNEVFGTYSDRPTGENAESDIDWYFQSYPADRGNDHFAEISANLCLKTYDNDGLNADSVEGYLKYDLGFQDGKIYSSDYGYQGAVINMHYSFAYTIAAREYRGADSDGSTGLLVIVARGSQSIREFGSDKFSGTSPGYRGYEVYDVVDAFAKNIIANLSRVVDPAKHYKVLLTGHSLGGAAVNLAAAQIIDNSVSNVTVKNKKTDVVCYSFGAIDSIRTDGTVSSGYESIHNITNYYDSFGPEGWPDIFSAAGNSRYGKFGHIDLFWKDLDKEFRSVKSHDMSTYCQAVKDGIIEYEKASHQKILAIRCPVDVTVYRGGELAGKIIGDEVAEGSSFLPMSAVDGAKYILLPDDEDYSFEITATDSGTMEVSVFDAETSGERTVFEGIALERGKTFTGKIGGSADPADLTLYVTDQNGEPTAEISRDGAETPLSEAFGRSPLPVLLSIAYLIVVIASPVIAVALLLRKKANR